AVRGDRTADPAGPCDGDGNLGRDSQAQRRRIPPPLCRGVDRGRRQQGRGRPGGVVQMKDAAEGHGTKWLPDLRQWWRKSGRNLDLPVDGVTGPTRPVGKHVIKVDAASPRLAKLQAGQYTLVVEAVREVGGRELLKIPFTWPATGTQAGKAQGSSELGAVSLSIK